MMQYSNNCEFRGIILGRNLTAYDFSWVNLNTSSPHPPTAMVYASLADKIHSKSFSHLYNHHQVFRIIIVSIVSNWFFFLWLVLRAIFYFKTYAFVRFHSVLFIFYCLLSNVESTVGKHHIVCLPLNFFPLSHTIQWSCSSEIVEIVKIAGIYWLHWKETMRLVMIVRRRKY